MNELLNCLLLSLHQNALVLPSVAIAEIIAYEKSERVSEFPTWLMGILTWRGIRIPLISLELMGSPLAEGGMGNIGSEINSRALIVILNRIYKVEEEEIKTGKNPKYPFFAIVISDIPELQRLTADRVHLVSNLSDIDPRFLMEVTVNMEKAFIPNLKNIWRMVDALPAHF